MLCWVKGCLLIASMECEKGGEKDPEVLVRAPKHSKLRPCLCVIADHRTFPAIVIADTFSFFSKTTSTEQSLQQITDQTLCLQHHRQDHLLFATMSKSPPHSDRKRKSVNDSDDLKVAAAPTATGLPRRSGRKRNQKSVDYCDDKKTSTASTTTMLSGSPRRSGSKRKSEDDSDDKKVAAAPAATKSDR